ncbi:alpha/beta hydrolase [Ruficoccus amylovorans]|uniref:Alpha/beta hydrolase n=1 Tax=Ruficoccus amylovorans TaxID=1804625 RepID=A0A842HCW0_9BACT|nr:alpha/beta hydrolase [Ruficoccus amylovorans]MBC2594345.1 alpha/beta hydrolase [Ruficoccus amylovorans]
MLNKVSSPLHPSDAVLSKARLTPYFLEDGEDFACMLVLPGGGYSRIAGHEGGPVAGWFNSLGISAAVLEYTTWDGAPIYPKPQQQALYAMRLLRAQAREHGIDPARIGVIGFSAGGHLAACVSHGFDREDWLLDPDGELAGISARPDASMLCYAVTSSGFYAHVSSYKNLLGPDVTEEQADFMSWEKHAHPQCPPTFLWHTAADETVPVNNSYLMALALQANKTPHELHVFPDGAHGRGLGTFADRRHPVVGQWRGLAERWLLGLGF